GADDRLRTRAGGRTLRATPRSGTFSAGPARSRGPYARMAQRRRFRSGHAARLARPRPSVRQPGAQLGERRASLRLRKPDTGGRRLARIIGAKRPHPGPGPAGPTPLSGATYAPVRAAITEGVRCA